MPGIGGMGSSIIYDDEMNLRATTTAGAAGDSG